MTGYRPTWEEAERDEIGRRVRPLTASEAAEWAATEPWTARDEQLPEGLQA